MSRRHPREHRPHVAALPDCEDTGKMSFTCQRDAVRFIRYLRHRSKRGIVPLRAYRCPLCRYWHMTSQELRGPRHLHRAGHQPSAPPYKITLRQARELVDQLDRSRQLLTDVILSLTADHGAP
ncbi:hypothetical protein DKM44_02225 [Deinococcus irradiatisoli]|uniref:Uncharacterized protein n=1 Tax=Deinococcus irradiatisoli TaxID=2202254 RepID=A0A2Z3JB73_9DEIO|nr:hypothetical protein [Deinococcus irradiatisoli]AWN22195.1 hypothetical protein DKM44_02225 [Deinococcus irradiatisoli]